MWLESFIPRVDFGPKVLASVFRLLQVEPNRSFCAPREFTWWPNEFAQRIWVTRVHHADFDFRINVHVETDLVKEVPDGSATAKALGLLNRSVSVSALVLRPLTGQICLHASVSVTRRTFHKNRFDIFATTVAILQAGDAAHWAPIVAGAVKAPIDRTVDPSSLARPRPHPGLRHLEAFAIVGEEPSRFARFGGLEEVKRILSWTMLEPLDDGLEGEFVYEGSAGERRRVQLGVYLGHVHLAVGRGLHLAMSLPIPGSADLVLRLNHLHAETLSGAHGYGAWCLEEYLRYELFLPNVLAKSGVMETAALFMIHRAEQAYQLASQDTKTAQATGRAI